MRIGQNILWAIPAYIVSCILAGISFWFPLSLLYAGDFTAFKVLHTSLPIGILAASLILFLAAKIRLPKQFFLSIWLITFLPVTATIGDIMLNDWREKVTAEFAPDAFELNRIRYEFHGEFVFYLHGQAIKDCVPYAWSYQTMSWYKLPQNIAPNVLRRDWIKACDLKRDYED